MRPAWIGFATRALPSPMVDICQTIYFACVTDFTEHRRMSIGRYLTPAASQMSMLLTEIVLIPCRIHAFRDRSREIAAKAARHCVQLRVCQLVSFGMGCGGVHGGLRWWAFLTSR